jgi:hypothetical protein
MPRRKTNTVTVEPWPDLKPGRLYKGRVRAIAIDKAGNQLDLTVENLDPLQQGRLHEIDLPLPVRPGNPTAAFLTACGIDANETGTTIDLDQIVGCVVGLRSRPPAAGQVEAFEFEKVAAPPTADGPEPPAPTERELWPPQESWGGQKPSPTD